jgi:hypothetical protein
MKPRTSFPFSGVRALIAVLLLPFTACVSKALATNGLVTPLVRAHAHNDYEHPRPLLDALEQGFCSVEADVHLVDGQLLVAHDPDQVRPDRTLQALYLEPLRDRVERHAGRVYRNGPEFSLLIDLKTDWQRTYRVLRPVLAGYTNILTTFSTTRHPRAVLVVISGNRSKEMFQGEDVRYAAYDGQLADLNTDDPADLVSWISGNWSSVFGWRGEGEFPSTQREKLKRIVSQAHAQGKKVRFWGAPDTPASWRVLLAHDVDLINTDSLAEFRRFVTLSPAVLSLDDR